MDIQSGSGIYYRQGAGIDLVRTASNVLTINSTVTNTDAQTLSFSSPNLSISGGNSVALPVLPSGTSGQTLRHDGSGWAATSLLKTYTNQVDVNTWPGTVDIGSRLLVNGYIQYNNNSTQATSITGRDVIGTLTGVTVGSGLSLSAGTLSSTATGTVTSVGITNGGGITVSGSPITTSGSITLTAADQSATNELQTLSNTSTASDHTATLSNSGGSLKIAMGTGIDVVSSGTTLNGVATVGLTGQALAVHNLASNGIIARTGSGTVSARTITAGDGISITNGDGVSGNPTITASRAYGALNVGTNTITTSAAKVNFGTNTASYNTTVSTASDRITVTPSGDYLINFNATAYGTDCIVSALLYVNGSAVYDGYSQCTLQPTYGGDTINFSCIETVSASGYFEVYISADQSGCSLGEGSFNVSKL